MKYLEWRKQVDEIALKEDMVPCPESNREEQAVWIELWHEGKTPQEAWDAVPER